MMRAGPLVTSALVLARGGRGRGVGVRMTGGPYAGLIFETNGVSCFQATSSFMEEPSCQFFNQTALIGQSALFANCQYNGGGFFN